MPVILAHQSDALAAAAWGRWTAEPLTLAVLIAASALYAIGARRLAGRTAIRGALRSWEIAAFFSGVIAIAVAVMSPLAWLAEQLLSFHMVQHSLLMVVAAPLLVLGRPLIALVWSLPAAWRPRAASAVRHPVFARTWHTITAPAMVFAVYGLALWLWHAPVLYQAALARESVHVLEHTCFLTTALLFWWTMVRGRFGPYGYGAAVLFVFLTAMHSGMLGALLTVQPTVLYHAYDLPARTWHVDPLADQQVAGLLMWVPFGVVFTAMGLALLAAWIGQSARRAAV